jgi:hypothetical protein
MSRRNEPIAAATTNRISCIFVHRRRERLAVSFDRIPAFPSTANLTADAGLADPASRLPAEFFAEVAKKHKRTTHLKMRLHMSDRVSYSVWLTGR